MKRVFLVSLALLASSFVPALVIARPIKIVQLDVPVVQRAPDRNGPASLAMVLGFYGADSSVQRRTDEAFDAQLGSTSLKDLVATAVRLGFSARVAEPGIDSLTTFLRSGVPPIVCIEPRTGIKAPNRYFVVTRWDTLGNRFFGRDGGSRPRELTVPVLQNVWEPGRGKALIVTRRRR